MVSDNNIQSISDFLNFTLANATQLYLAKGNMLDQNSLNS